MKIPSIDECYRIMHRMEMPDHIVAHSIQVCRVAACISDLLSGEGISLNRDLIRAAALLHDITKIISFATGENHAFTGAKLISDLGYPETGGIIGQHVRLNKYFNSPVPEEAEVVNYADKRVTHDSICTLEERCDYIIERYGTEPQRRELILQMFKNTYLLEKRLFLHLPIGAEELTAHITPPDCTSEFTAYRRVIALSGDIDLPVAAHVTSP